MNTTYVSGSGMEIAKVPTMTSQSQTRASKASPRNHLTRALVSCGVGGTVQALGVVAMFMQFRLSQEPGGASAPVDRGGPDLSEVLGPTSRGSAGCG